MPEPTPANLAFNIAAGEVLQPQAVIELHASRPVGPRLIAVMPGSSSSRRFSAPYPSKITHAGTPLASAIIATTSFLPVPSTSQTTGPAFSP